MVFAQRGGQVHQDAPWPRWLDHTFCGSQEGVPAGRPPPCMAGYCCPRQVDPPPLSLGWPGDLPWPTAPGLPKLDGEKPRAFPCLGLWEPWTAMCSVWLLGRHFAVRRSQLAKWGGCQRARTPGRPAAGPAQAPGPCANHPAEPSQAGGRASSPPLPPFQASAGDLTLSRRPPKREDRLGLVLKL